MLENSPRTLGAARARSTRLVRRRRGLTWLLLAYVNLAPGAGLEVSYLRSHPEPLGTAHSTIAKTSLSYLNPHQVKPLSASPLPISNLHPFLVSNAPSCSTSSPHPFSNFLLYRGIHTKEDVSDSAESLAQRLFDDCINRVFAEILLKQTECLQHPFR